jgi:hypothetical protein
MGGGNDAGGLQVYAQMGQGHGMKVLWCLALLVLGTFSVGDLGCSLSADTSCSRSSSS